MPRVAVEDNWQWHALIIIENNIDNMENNIDNWEQYWQYWPSEGQWSAPDWQIHAASENQELHQHSISINISISIIINITYTSAPTLTASSTSASVLTAASVAILIAQIVEKRSDAMGVLLRSIFKNNFELKVWENLGKIPEKRCCTGKHLIVPLAHGCRYGHDHRRICTNHWY